MSAGEKGSSGTDNSRSRVLDKYKVVATVLGVVLLVSATAKGRALVRGTPGIPGVDV
jgi:hypothetical protein